MIEPADIPAAHRYGTHLPALIACVLRTTGPVLEMGAGLWSTPVLAALCGACGRRLVTVEQDAAWLARALRASGPRHPLHEALGDYDDPAIDAGRWSVVLIDHVTERRQPDLMRLAGRAELLVAHDADVASYGWDFSSFRHVMIFQEMRPWTAVLSNERPVGA